MYRHAPRPRRVVTPIRAGGSSKSGALICVTPRGGVKNKRTRGIHSAIFVLIAMVAFILFEGVSDWVAVAYTSCSLFFTMTGALFGTENSRQGLYWLRFNPSTSGYFDSVSFIDSKFMLNNFVSAIISFKVYAIHETTVLQP